MLTRRHFILLGSAAAAVALHSPSAFAARHSDFMWRRAGVDKYQGTFEQALGRFNDIVPASVLEQFREKYRKKRYFRDEIPNNYRFTRMMFGKNKARSNVIAVTSKWSRRASRMADVYTVSHTDGRVYVLFRPHVCGNWGVAIFTPQGVCIRDPALCGDGDCKKKQQK